MQTEDKIMILLVSLIVVCLGGAVYVDYKQVKFSLVKSDWQCTLSHNETALVPYPTVNGGTILMPTIETVCDQYSRKVGT